MNKDQKMDLAQKIKDYDQAIEKSKKQLMDLQRGREQMMIESEKETHDKSVIKGLNSEEMDLFYQEELLDQLEQSGKTEHHKLKRRIKISGGIMVMAVAAPFAMGLGSDYKFMSDFLALVVVISGAFLMAMLLILGVLHWENRSLKKVKKAKEQQQNHLEHTQHVKRHLLDKCRLMKPSAITGK